MNSSGDLYVLIMADGLLVLHVSCAMKSSNTQKVSSCVCSKVMPLAQYVLQIHAVSDTVQIYMILK